jgi:hypothetical protein
VALSAELLKREARHAVPVGFVELEAAIDAFAARPQAVFTAAEIGEQVVHLVRCADKLRLEAARVMGAFAGTGEAEAQGSNDDVDWLRHHARTSVADALALRAVGTQLERITASVDALKRGEIGFGHVLHLARNAGFSEKSGKGEFDETPLLTRARMESVSRFRRTALSFRHIQDPQGVQDAEVEAVEYRNLTFSTTDDGRHFINVELDPLGYLAARTAIEARAVRNGSDDHRNRARVRAEGLIDMCMDDMTRTAKPSESLSPVHIVVHASMETFLDRPGSPAAETEYDAMLSGKAVGRLSCDASVSAILLDGKLMPVGVSKLKRQLSGREMRALRLLYPRCARPGCSRPASQCEAHHVTWWSRGHKTQVEDMCMLCPQHHWQVHEGGWQMARREDGGFVFLPPQFSRGPTERIPA